MIEDMFGVRLKARAQPRIKNWACPYFLPVPSNVQLQPSTASRGEEWGGGVHPPQPARGPGQRNKLTQQGQLVQSPSRKRFWGVSCAVLCDFTHILVHLTAAAD